MLAEGYNGCVKSVDIQQLEAQLPLYVRKARAGEIILVTERDEVVAEIRPPRLALMPQSSGEDVDMFAEAGEVTRPSIKKDEGWRWQARGLGLSSVEATAILDALGDG